MYKILIDGNTMDVVAFTRLDNIDDDKILNDRIFYAIKDGIIKNVDYIIMDATFSEIIKYDVPFI